MTGLDSSTFVSNNGNSYNSFDTNNNNMNDNHKGTAGGFSSYTQSNRQGHHDHSFPGVSSQSQKEVINGNNLRHNHQQDNHASKPASVKSFSSSSNHENHSGKKNHLNSHNDHRTSVRTKSPEDEDEIDEKGNDSDPGEGDKTTKKKMTTSSNSNHHHHPPSTSSSSQDNHYKKNSSGKQKQAGDRSRFDPSTAWNDRDSDDMSEGVTGGTTGENIIDDVAHNLFQNNNKNFYPGEENLEDPFVRSVLSTKDKDSSELSSPGETVTRGKTPGHPEGNSWNEASEMEAGLDMNDIPPDMVQSSLSGHSSHGSLSSPFTDNNNKNNFQVLSPFSGRMASSFREKEGKDKMKTAGGRGRNGFSRMRGRDRGRSRGKDRERHRERSRRRFRSRKKSRDRELSSSSFEDSLDDLFGSDDDEPEGDDEEVEGMEEDGEESHRKILGILSQNKEESLHTPFTPSSDESVLKKNDSQTSSSVPSEAKTLDEELTELEEELREQEEKQEESKKHAIFSVKSRLPRGLMKGNKGGQAGQMPSVVFATNSSMDDDHSDMDDHDDKGGGGGGIRDCGIQVPEKFVAIQKVIQVPRISVFEHKEKPKKVKTIKLKKKKKKCKKKKCLKLKKLEKEKVDFIEIDSHADHEDEGHYGFH